jgi:hypothetical protein
MNRSSASRASIAFFACFLAVFVVPAKAQDYHGKATMALYHAGDTTSTDLNVRYSLAGWTGWLGYYGATDDTRQARAGIEYDFRRPGVYLVPSAQIASQGFLGGSMYAEVGRPIYLVAGFSRTDLKPYTNLTFDPNESWQLGAGVHLNDTDSVSVFTIWDNRLDTGQQITHAVIRHELPHTRRLTVDVSYKSGHGDDGAYVRGGAESLEYDWHRYFVKLARDQHANYGEPTMWRFGGGFRF